MLRGAQCQVMSEGSRFLVDVDSFEVEIFAHDGSAYSEPHNHLHVQVGAKVPVNGEWQAIDGPGLMGSLREWQSAVDALRARRPWWKRTLTNKHHLF